MTCLFSPRLGDIICITRYESESDPFWLERLRFIANNIDDPEVLVYSWLHCNDMFFGTKYSIEYESKLMQMRNLRLNPDMKRVEPIVKAKMDHQKEVDRILNRLNLGSKNLITHFADESTSFSDPFPSLEKIYNSLNTGDVFILYEYDSIGHDFSLSLGGSYRSKREWDYLARLAGFKGIYTEYTKNNDRGFYKVYQK